MKTSKTLFCLMLFTLVVLNEGRPARNNSRHGQQVHCARVKGRRCMEDDECACVNRHNGTLICNFDKRCEKPGFSLYDFIRKQPCQEVFKRTCEVHDDCPCSKQPFICEDRECVKAKKCNIVEGQSCSKAGCVCLNHHNAKVTLTCNSENKCER